MDSSNANVRETTYKLVLAALFAAMTTVATMLIHINTLKGYIHIGDCFVILSGIVLGPVYGGAAAGIGSMLADLFSGYPVFSVATLVIKFASAAAAGLIYRKIGTKVANVSLRDMLSSIPSALIVTAGYFLFEIPLEGLAAAVAEIGPNLLQGASGIVLSMLLLPILLKIPVLRSLTPKRA